MCDFHTVRRGTIAGTSAGSGNTAAAAHTTTDCSARTGLDRTNRVKCREFKNGELKNGELKYGELEYGGI